MKNFYENFYKDSGGQRRKVGIFAPGLDRFILIDDCDIWITLQTAEILSAKLPTLVYILPPLEYDLNSLNCFNYSIFNKSQQKVGTSNIAVSRQQPMLKFLTANEGIYEAGVPEDYKEDKNNEMLLSLKEYASYVHKRSYAISFVDAMYNYSNTKKFVEQNVSPSWTKNISTKADSTNTNTGVLFEIKQALYLSNDPLEAEEKILDIWLNSQNDQNFLISGYYKILDKPMPKVLLEKIKNKPDTISTFLF